MEREFCKFLIKIGMIDEETSSTFIRIYNDIYKEEKDINIFELSFQILITFLNNITNTQKNYMCHNLPLKFYEIHEKYKKDKLISILMKNKLKNKLNLLKYLYIWKNNKRQKIKEKLDRIKKSINIFKKNNTFIKRNTKNAKLNTIYKIPHHARILIVNNLKDESINVNDNNQEQECISNDDNLTKKASSQLFLSNESKNNNDLGVKVHYNSITNISSKERNQTQSGGNLLSSKRQKQSMKNSRSTYDVKTSWEYNEEKELKECTFKPKINITKRVERSLKMPSSYQKKKGHQSRFNKLYYDSEKYKLSKQIKAIELDHMINKDLTFNPTINNNIQNMSKEMRKDKFEKRIQSYLEIKNKHSEEIKNKINEEFEQNYSFTPNINTPKNNSNISLFTKTINNEKNESHNMSPIPVYLRLFEESKLRNRRQNQRKRENEIYLDNLSNSLIKTKPVVNINKIYKLYENKEKNIINEKTKSKVEIEEGITFKPYIYINKFAKNINSNFYERNSKFLDDKKKFIDMHQKNFKSKNDISPNDKKEIVKNIIDRLYNDSKTGNIGCNKYIKSVQGSYSNINNKYEAKINDNYMEYNSFE